MCHHQPNQHFVEEDDEDSIQHEEEFEDPFQCSVDWNSPPIYDKDLVEVSSLPYSQVNVEVYNTYHVFNKSPKSEVHQWSLEKMNGVDFFILKTCQVFLTKILMLASAC